MSVRLGLQEEVTDLNGRPPIVNAREKFSPSLRQSRPSALP